MRRNQILLLSVLIFLIITLLAYMYLLNIYETEISVTPKELFADNHSIVVISVIPLNSFGKKIPFRKVSAEFEIIEGKDLVSVEKLNRSEGFLVLKAGDKTGAVSIIVKSEKSLLPSYVRIPVKPNYACANYFK